MAYFLPEPPLSIEQQSKTGILLMNLGTPDAPTAAAVRPYLRQFLSDRRVVDLPKFAWQIILNAFVLPFRPKQSAHAYSRVWQHEGSPLAIFTQRQAAALQVALPNVLVRYAMSYGNPSAAEVIAQMKAQGVGRILLLPLYPQYAASSTGAAIDKVLNVLLRQRNQIGLRTVSRFYDHPAYINAMKKHIEQYWAQHGKSDTLLLSFHGIPQAVYEQGDPYPDECCATARLLAQALGLPEDRYIVAFQSQFGKGQWVKPSTQDLLDTLPHQGVNSLDVFCPGFMADCLETLEEIAIMGREQFHEAGGTRYHAIPCLNDNAVAIEMLKTLAEENLGGWID